MLHISNVLCSLIDFLCLGKMNVAVKKRLCEVRSVIQYLMAKYYSMAIYWEIYNVHGTKGYMSKKLCSIGFVHLKMAKHRYFRIL